MGGKSTWELRAVFDKKKPVKAPGQLGVLFSPMEEKGMSGLDLSGKKNEW